MNNFAGAYGKAKGTAHGNTAGGTGAAPRQAGFKMPRFHSLSLGSEHGLEMKQQLWWAKQKPLSPLPF